MLTPNQYTFYYTTAEGIPGHCHISTHSIHGSVVVTCTDGQGSAPNTGMNERQIVKEFIEQHLPDVISGEQDFPVWYEHHPRINRTVQLNFGDDPFAGYRENDATWQLPQPERIMVTPEGVNTRHNRTLL